MSTAPKWTEIRVDFKKKYSLGHDPQVKREAIFLTHIFADKFKCRMYFACYHVARPRRGKLFIKMNRLQIRAFDVGPRKPIVDWFKSGSKMIERVSFGNCEGSFPHAAMFEVSRYLYDKTDREADEIVHWMMNMTGKTYAQEAVSMASLSYSATNRALIANGLLPRPASS